MAEIEFIETLIASTQLPGISFDDERVYSTIFSAAQEPEVSYVSGQGNVVSIVTCASGETFSLNDVWNLGALGYDEIVAAIPPSYSAQAMNIKLAATPDGRYEMYAIMSMKDEGLDPVYDNYVDVSVSTEILIIDHQGLDVSIPLDSFRININKQLLGLTNRVRFGLASVKLPDREENLPNRLLMMFYGFDDAISLDPHNNFVFPAGQQTPVTYNFAPGAYYYPSAECAYRLAGCIDLAAFDLWEIDGLEMVYDETSPEAGDPSEPDGYKPGSGRGDDSSDTIDIPDVPDIGVSNVGFVNVYKTYQHDLQDMGIELFPPLSYNPPSPPTTGVGVADAVIELCQNFTTFAANIPTFFEQINAATYINYIIDCHVLPVTPPGGSSENIKVGNKTLTVSGDRLSSDYVDVDCGTISLGEYYSNFADFLTTFKLYLPFVGFVPAQPEWFYRESLNVTYRFNVIDGSFMAFVRSTGAYVNNNNSGKTIVGQYGGNACVHLPITGVTYASMVSGLVGAGAGAVAGASAGNLGAVATSALAAANAHGNIAQSNSYSSSVSFLGCRRPFVLIERPVSNYPTTYAKELGIPSNISRKLGNVTGFNVIGDVHLDGIDATDAEKAEIGRLLHEGVIL